MMNISFFLGVVLVASSVNHDRDPTPTYHAVASAIRDAHNRLSQLEFDGYHISLERGKRDQIDRIMTAYGKGGQFFMDLIHDTDRGEAPWLDPWRQRIWWEFNKMVVLRVFERNALHQDPKRGLPLLSSHYIHCIGWRPPDNPMIPGYDSTRRTYLPDLLDETSDDYVVAHEDALVNGLKCLSLVSRSGRDRLWVSPDCGYALVRRILTNDAPHLADVDSNCTNFREVTPGIWLPLKTELKLRWPSGIRAPAHYVIELDAIRVNQQVSDQLFRPEFPPGTHVFDQGNILVGTVPGGTEVLSLWIAVAAELFPRRLGVGASPHWDYVNITTGTAFLLAGLAIATLRNGPLPRGE